MRALLISLLGVEKGSKESNVLNEPGYMTRKTEEAAQKIQEGLTSKIPEKVKDAAKDVKEKIKGKYEGVKDKIKGQ